MVRREHGIKGGQRIGPKNKDREEGGDPRTEEQRKPKENGMQEREPDADHPSLPHGVTTNGFQVLLSSITCLPS